jgi:hypothetical protein
MPAEIEVISSKGFQLIDLKVVINRIANGSLLSRESFAPTAVLLALLFYFFWIIGLVSNIGGPLIHTLLVIAVAIFLFDLIVGRRAV